MTFKKKGSRPRKKLTIKDIVEIEKKLVTPEELAFIKRNHKRLFAR